MRQAPIELPRTDSPKLFRRSFLLSLLAISILTNVILVARLYYPNVWQDLQLALVSAPELAATDHVRGNPDAAVTVIEYSDFQCPFCAKFHVDMKALVKETDVRWIYRHYPLAAIHPLATKAAEASECAGAQNGFWAYSDALFEARGKITDAVLTDIARAMELDLDAFETCLTSGKFRARVLAQREEGASKKILGTPTFFVNGKRYGGALPYADLKKLFIRLGGEQSFTAKKLAGAAL